MQACRSVARTMVVLLGGVVSVRAETQEKPLWLSAGGEQPPRLPSEYLKQVWLDIVSPLPLAMEYAVEFMGAERLLFASDHPWVDPRQIKACLLSLGLPPSDERRILGDNARRLFGLS